MSEIVLKRANVVKRVDSEDKAKALEEKGFVRADGRTALDVNSDALVVELKSQIIKAGEVIKTADARRGELEKKLAEAEDRIRTLETELSGTKEQLEAAVEKNKETAKKGK